MPKIKNEVRRGDLFWAKLDPTFGSELQKTRPVIILSITPLNTVRRTIIVVPLSTSAPEIDFLNVALTGGSVARCEHTRAIDKSRLASKIGTISEVDMQKIEVGLSRILGIIARR